ncbi:hypothetical protein C1Y11_16310 [Pseudomonas sp. FW305-20]|nr:hypothetical protein C1Y11_16310 [Pseudomonas sp. FW305-20]PMU18704.1 hypothetical protein C1Y10_12520 [Pseudomonas sp. FW305-122]PMU40907.1 hypothetical protein C1Y12_09105 [Pseudomonas sp. FW305-47B]PMX61310.1 hypothetical protein C1Y13_11965 [Pseudomonas sp. FW305-33]PMX68945.1 hypothetical protein C1X12_09220 [Pseudomonas sp. FW305-60]
MWERACSRWGHIIRHLCCLSHCNREQAHSHRFCVPLKICSKATYICTESATAERYRYTPSQSPLCKALIHLRFFLRLML